MIPEHVLQAVAQAALPCFVYDEAMVKQRAEWVLSLVDRLYFPIKACPEPGVIRAALSAGCGLDLCSTGDADIAEAAGCAGHLWKFTSASAEDSLLRRLSQVGATLDADSLEQALRWGSRRGTACGLRMTAKRPHALYGAKFGIPATEIAMAANRLAAAGVHLEGLHLHDQHANLTPAEFATRLAQNFEDAGSDILQHCRYINIGGSWPMRHGNPASVEELREAIQMLREHLAGLGFQGTLCAEPGRWIAGPCGYWAAQVVAVKPHPRGGDRKVVILDTSTPVPCRPSLAPFAVLRNKSLVQSPPSLTCDIFGSANTALDTIGSEVRLPNVAEGDIVVSLGQGAYTRSLIPPFNERERPGAIVLSHTFQSA